MLKFLKWAFGGSFRSQRGWTAAIGPVVGALTSKMGAKASANDAANAQQNLTNTALATEAKQGNELRKFLAHQAKGPNPFEQAAKGMSPMFSAPGQDVASFGPTSIFGQQITPPPANASFNAPPPQAAPQVAGWGPQYAPAPPLQGGGGNTVPRQ